MVTELMIRMNVMILTNTNGAFTPSGAKGKLLNTSLGSGHPLVEKRMVPYEIRNAPNVKASLIRKYHIINLPYSTLKGLFPPPHNLVVVAVVVVAMIVQKNFVTKILAVVQKSCINANFFLNYPIQL